MARILVVDDETRMAGLIQRELIENGHAADTAPDGPTALQKIGGAPFDMVLTDLNMPGMDGLGLLDRIREGAPDMEVVLMTAFASAQTAVEAMKRGAYDYLIKPFEMDELLIMVDRIEERRRLRVENASLRAGLEASAPSLVGHSKALAHVLEMVARVAGADTTVLVQGESGTGKELVARAIHAASHRSAGPMIPVNCGAIPETLLESELFGHERGAFTGAGERRLGRFELADGGTVFLDEVGELSPQAQVKLLRVLQEKIVERVGGSVPVPVDVRVIAATNRDPEAMVAEGTFREDLFYRLNVFPIRIPPLRDRREDIPELARYLLGRLDARSDLAPETLEALRSYRWPGNVRELENVLERAVILAGPGRPVLLEHVAGLAGSPTQEGGGGLPGGGSMRVRIPEEGVDLEELEKDHILEALRRADGNKSEAARLLHMTRRRLYSRLDHHGIPY